MIYRRSQPSTLPGEEGGPASVSRRRRQLQPGYLRARYGPPSRSAAVGPERWRPQHRSRPGRRCGSSSSRRRRRASSRGLRGARSAAMTSAAPGSVHHQPATALRRRGRAIRLSFNHAAARRRCLRRHHAADLRLRTLASLAPRFDRRGGGGCTTWRRIARVVDRDNRGVRVLDAGWEPEADSKDPPRCSRVTRTGTREAGVFLDGGSSGPHAPQS